MTIAIDGAEVVVVVVVVVVEVVDVVLVDVVVLVVDVVLVVLVVEVVLVVVVVVGVNPGGQTEKLSSVVGVANDASPCSTYPQYVCVNPMVLVRLAVAVSPVVMFVAKADNEDPLSVTCNLTRSPLEIVSDAEVTPEDVSPKRMLVAVPIVAIREQYDEWIESLLKISPTTDPEDV